MYVADVVDKDVNGETQADAVNHWKSHPTLPNIEGVPEPVKEQHFATGGRYKTEKPRMGGGVVFRRYVTVKFLSFKTYGNICDTHLRYYSI